MDQDVLFRIGLADHPETGPRLKALADSVRSTMADIEQSIVSVGRTAEAAQRSVAAGGSRITSAVPITVAAAAGSATAFPTATYSASYEAQVSRLASTQPVQITQQAAAGPSAAPSQSSPVAQKARNDARQYKTSFSDALSQMTGMSGDDLTVLTGGNERRWRQIGKENGASYREGIRESMSQALGLTESQSAELFGAKGGAGLKQQQQQYKAETDKLTQSLTANIQAYAELDTKGQSITKGLGQNFRELAERSEGFASGIGQVASGLAFLGAKNKDIETLVQTLLSIKGVADVGVGTVKTISNIAQVISLWGERQKMASEQNEVAAEKTRLARTAAAQYVQMLEREGIALEKAMQGNKEHAAILARVAAEARNAAAAEREHANAANNTPLSGSDGGTGGGGFGGGRRGRRGRGLFGRLGNFMGGRGRNLLSFGGSMLFGAGGLASTGSDIGDELADEGVDQLLDRLGQRGGARSFGRMAGRVGRVAGPLAAAAGVGKGLFDLGSGIINEGEFKFRDGSLSQRLSAGASGIGGRIDSMLGIDTIHAQAYSGQVEIDKKIAERRKREEKESFRNAAADENRFLGLAGQYELADQRLSAFDSVSNIRRQFRTDVESLRIKQANLQAELQGEQQLASLRLGDGTRAGQRQFADSQNRQMQIGTQAASVAALAQGVADLGAPTAQQELDQKRLSIQTDLRGVMGDIKTLGADIDANEKSYVAAQQRAFDLTSMLKGVEEEQLRLIGEQTQKRIAGNQAAIDGANRRIELFRREKQAAEDTLKSGAERFASMSRSDQAAAIRAQQLANAGMANQLTDRQRGLLRNIGTESATKAAEQADLSEARQRGFFAVFGKEEQQRAAKAAQFEQQARVEIVNKQAVNVQLQVDVDRIADRVAKQVVAIENRLLANMDKRIELRVQKERAANMQQANQQLAKANSQRQTTTT